MKGSYPKEVPLHIFFLASSSRSTSHLISLMAATAAPKLMNVNIGILGHVDSGKTSLVKALSTSLSTAALDKNPQSQQRGITLDLGFSSFTIELPPHLQSASEEYTALQVHTPFIFHSS